MTGSPSAGQNEANPVFWLAIYTQAGKMALAIFPTWDFMLWSYIQGKSLVGCNKSFINQAYLVTMILLNMNLLASFFFAFISTLNLSWSIKQRKQKTLANIQPNILTSHMVDNAYLFSCKMLFGEGITSHWKRCLVVGWALARLSTKLLIKLVISHKLELKPLKKPLAWRIKQTPLHKLKNSKDPMSLCFKGAVSRQISQIS